jgi:Na+-driven multidrug efflux pump
MFIAMAVQVAYFVTDMKFVSMLGNEVAAGFAAAGNLWFLVLALTQILNAGTAAMVSHAVGAQQHERANLVFNQSLMLSFSWASSCSHFCTPWRIHTCTWKRLTRWLRRRASTIWSA